jgi:hypothetical protein
LVPDVARRRDYLPVSAQFSASERKAHPANWSTDGGR